MSRPTSDADFKRRFQTLEKQLSTLKLGSVPVPYNSFYRAVARQLDLQRRHSDKPLRQECVKYLRDNEVIGSDKSVSWTDELKEVYLSRIINSQQEYVDENVIQAAANLRKTKIKIYCSDSEPFVIEPKAPSREEPPLITIGRLAGTDYCSVEPKKEEKEKESSAKKDVANGENEDRSGSNCQADPAKSKKWKDFEVETEQEDEKKDGLKIVTKVAKFISAFVFCALVLLGGITTKSTFLVLGNAYSQDYSTSTCLSVGNQYYHIKYMVMLIFMSCLCFPEVLALLFSIWEVIKHTKKKHDDKNRRDRTSDSDGNGAEENRQVSHPAERESNTNHQGGQTSENNPNVPNPDENSDPWILACFLGTMLEVLHAIGLTFLTLKVIPQIDSTLASLAFSFVATIPAIIHVISKFIMMVRKNSQVRPEDGRREREVPEDTEEEKRRGRKKQEQEERENKKKNIDRVLGLIAVILLPAGFGLGCWQIYEQSADRDDRLKLAIVTAVCLILISSRYWENFVWPGIGKKEGRIVQKLKEKRFKWTIIYSLIRMGVIVVCCFLIHFVIEKNKAVVTYRGKVPVYFREGPRTSTKCSRIISSLWNTGFTNVLSSFGTFFFGFVACQSRVQIPSFLIPLALVNPGMSILTSVYNMEGAQLGKTLMEFYRLPVPHAYIDEFIDWKTYDTDWRTMGIILTVGVFTGCLGLVLVTSYLWKNPETAMQKVDAMFVKPIFAGFMINEAMMLNHTRYESRSDRIHNTKPGETTEENAPEVFLCATLWHENPTEMKQLLTSIVRTVEKEIEKEIDKKVFAVEAPYGGRIEITLPGKNRMFIHLKDVEKIRKKKRWSQCMYLSYILRFLPYNRKKNGELSDMNNMYILALDGDVDFQPRAMTFLLDKMKVDDKVGAACGRIHPIGGGPVVWFQKFEYAVGHWLQKTAEDVLGCVLCSPGCFSLFRGKALYQKNVAGKYASTASEAKHALQWDQGEDRWLCTLLLKAGYKIEYCAASDSYTFAPEYFKEFYNQRRRWSPSTLANIFDILLDAKKVVDRNPNISWGYIVYQIGLMFASLLGPSTVVLIIQGAFQYVFGMNPIGGLMAALIPVVIFAIICYTTKADTQIIVAMVLTLTYALVMMAVLVGAIGQMAESLLNASSIFMLLMIAIFTFTGLLHPTEMKCLVHGLLYYICVPSAFIFLPIFCYCNMNEQSWGTRDSGEKKKTDAANGSMAEDGNYGCGLGNMCRCMLCIKPPQYQKVLQEEPDPDSESEPDSTPGTNPDIMEQWDRAALVARDANNLLEVLEKVCWEKDVPLKFVESKKIDEEEKEFWEELVAGQLAPPKETATQKEKDDKMIEELYILKNKMSAAYLFINSLWLVLTFSLNQVIHDVNITLYDRYGNPTVLNPLAFLFLIFFFVILLIQFITMLIHRWSTFLHLMGKTSLRGKSDDDDKRDKKKSATNGSGQPQVETDATSGNTNLSYDSDEPGTSGRTSSKREGGDNMISEEEEKAAAGMQKLKNHPGLSNPVVTTEPQSVKSESGNEMKTIPGTSASQDGANVEQVVTTGL